MSPFTEALQQHWESCPPSTPPGTGPAASSKPGTDPSKNLAALSNFDPVEFSRDFCRVAEEDTLETMRVLNVDQVKALAICLKNRANMKFDLQAEK